VTQSLKCKRAVDAVPLDSYEFFYEGVLKHPSLEVQIRGSLSNEG